jgi:hypothetical protein
MSNQGPTKIISASTVCGLCFTKHLPCGASVQIYPQPRQPHETVMTVRTATDVVNVVLDRHELDCLIAALLEEKKRLEGKP